MLTNNKKNFVRSIAMLLVLLMVVAMGLTACKKGAITEEVDPTVDQKLAAALEPYIKADDKATVAAIVKEVLGDEGISAEKVETLTTALDKYITADDAKALITDEVAKLAMDDAMTKQDVLDILKDYYTKDQIDDKLESYFGEFAPAQVHAMLKDVDKAMNLEEWDDASEVVIATIADMQDLLTAVNTQVYTQENMKKINAALESVGIAAPFVKATAAATKLSKPSSMAEYGKLLEYRILRVATLEEVEELKAAVDEALAVPNFASELKALENALYALGENVKYGSYTGTNNAFVAEKWPNVDGTYTYHNVNYAKNTEKLTQVVTLNDKAGFYAWNKNFDALYTKYYLDGADGLTIGTVYDIYRKDTTTVNNGVSTTTTDLVLQLATNTTAPTGYTKVGSTIIHNVDYARKVLGIDETPANTVLSIDSTWVNGELENKGAAFSETNANHNVVTDYKATGKYGYAADPTTFSDVNTNMIATDPLSAAYSSIVAQLNACQAAANTANTNFDGFQQNTIYANGAAAVFGNPKKEYTKVTDADLLAALTAAMCEPGGNLTGVTFLTDVTAKMNISLTMNGKSEVGITEYELYKAMLSKAYDLLWDKYKVAAQKTAATMLKDYISLVYEAKGHDVATNGQVGNAVLSAKSTADLAAAMTAGGENTVAADLTIGFVDAYLNGTTDGKLAGTFYETLNKNFNNTKLIDYYVNNGQAKKITTVVGAGMTYDAYQANPLSSLKANAADIAQRLTGSMLSVSLKIDGASKDAMKASGVAVEEAFDTFLAEGVANLDEIIARFIIEDYKAKTYNDMIVKINSIFNYYGTNASGVAAMQQYLMGVDANNNFGGTVAYSDTANTKVKSWTFGKNSFEETLTNAQLLTNVTAVTLNPYATSNGVETVKVAAEAQKQIDAAAANATAVIENVAIKANFLNYLEAARMSWLNVYRLYDAKVQELDNQNFELRLRMSMLSSEVDDTITVIKYYAEMDGIDLMAYKANYVEILAMIGARTNPHLALLQNKSIEEVMADAAANTLGAKTFTDSAAKVLSTKSLANDTTKKEEWVIGLGVNRLGVVKIDTLDHVGTSVVKLDQLVNENTQIKTTVLANNTSSTANLYN